MPTNFEPLADTFSGTCLVVGNGPSLKDAPAKLLKKYPTFGSNRCYLPPVSLTPTFYVCVNPLVLEQNHDEIEAIQSPHKFIREGMGFGSAYELHSMAAPLFSFNPSAYVYEGYTVTFVSLQLAFFLGFETVLLVGVDHRYTFDGKPNEEKRMTGADPNHFSPDYFKGMAWNNPDLEKSEAAYRLALKVFTDNDRKIINLTPDSALTVFKKDRLAKWM